MDYKDIEKKYRKDAEELIDLMFDNGFFADWVKRKDMRAMEYFIAHTFQSGMDSYIRGHEFLQKINKLNLCKKSEK